jgi:hypothetical protein
MCPAYLKTATWLFVYSLQGFLTNKMINEKALNVTICIYGQVFPKKKKFIFLPYPILKH